MVAGVDEAGRGPLAGPVVASAVILPENHGIEGLDDSKKLTAKKRKKLFDEINEAADVGIGIVSHRTIDKINILQATFKAMRQAINKLEEPPHKSLIDGFGFPDQKLKNEGIIDGDNKVESISAASIIAKVTRDSIMKDINPIFPEYGFAKHKGYGTKYHMNALRELKATPIHRKSFKPVKENLPNMHWLKSKKKISLMGEQLVALQYYNSGYTIIEMNRTCSHYGELDIIAQKNNEWIFIEVKTATKDQVEGPTININDSKLQKLGSAIEYFLSKKEDDKNIRLDVATVMLNKIPTIQNYKGISLD